MPSKITFAIAVVLIAAAMPADAQTRSKANAATIAQGGTEQENAACRRDTRRLCRHIKADAGNSAFLSCLQEHRKNLSKGCDEVLKSHGM